MSTPLSLTGAEDAWKEVGNHWDNVSMERAAIDSAVRAKDEENLVKIMEVGDFGARNEAHWEWVYQSASEREAIMRARAIEDKEILRSAFDHGLKIGAFLTKQASFINETAEKRSTPTAPEVLSNRVTTTMSKVNVSKLISEYPKGSGTYYTFECAICGRQFDSAGGMYSHLNQSDDTHRKLLGGASSHKRAVDIGGVLITDASALSVEAHNNRARGNGPQASS